MSHAVASCRNCSSQKLNQAQLITFATACIATWDATCIATWETRVASWALAYHVRFPLVAVDLRQNRIKPDLYHKKSLRHAMRQALRQGKPLSHAVASCRNGSSQKLSQVQLTCYFCDSMHCDMGKPRSQAGRWLIMCVLICDKIV